MAIRGSTQIMAGTILDAQIAAGAAVATAKLADGANFLKRDGSVAMTGAFNAGSQAIINVATPVNPTDAANKSYVDVIAQGLSQKPTARLATTVALPANTYANGAAGVGATLTAAANGALTVDGVAVAAGDVVLVKNEATQANSGLYCVDAETEILTASGFKGCDRLCPGERVLTLNVETGLSEWQPLEAVHRFPKANRRVLRMEGPQHSSVSSMDHRWPVLDHGRLKIVRSHQLGTFDQIVRAAPCASLPVRPAHPDALVELVAWFLCEGHVRPLDSGREGRNVRVVQSGRVNSPFVARIRNCLTAMFGQAVDSLYGRLASPCWREDPDHHGMVTFSLNATASSVLLGWAPGRVPTAAFLTALTQAQLNLFIDVCIWGDGSRASVGRTRYFGQKSLARMDAVQMAATLAGYSTNVGKTRPDGTSVLSIGTRLTVAPLWARGGYPSRYEESETDFDGELWCPQTANGTWLARRRGTTYFTGNTVTQAGDATHPYILTRHADMDQPGEFSGAFVPVDNEGTANRNTMWLANNMGAVTVGTTAVLFTQIAAPTSYTQGNGVVISAAVISVNNGAGLNFSGGALQVQADVTGGTNLGTCVNVSSNGVAVKIDNATVAVNGSNQLSVKNAGVGAAQLAAQPAGTGLAGGAGTALSVQVSNNEVPSGSVNGSNTAFTLAHTPVAGTEQVYLNGVKLFPGAGNDYTASGAALTMLAAPLAGDRLTATYFY